MLFAISFRLCQLVCFVCMLLVATCYCKLFVFVFIWSNWSEVISIYIWIEKTDENWFICATPVTNDCTTSSNHMYKFINIMAVCHIFSLFTTQFSLINAIQFDSIRFDAFEFPPGQIAAVFIWCRVVTCNLYFRNFQHRNSLHTINLTLLCQMTYIFEAKFCMPKKKTHTHTALFL